MLGAYGLGAWLVWEHYRWVIGWLLRPANGALSATGVPVFTSPTEMFSVAMNLTLVGGFVLAVPMLVFQLARFFSPIMSSQQRRFVVLFLPAALVCFLTGAAFAYWVLLPIGLGFLLQFGADVATPMIRVSEYIGLTLAMIGWLGVVFELPLAMFLLAKLRLVRYERLKQVRRYVPVAAWIFSVVITPTNDFVNMVLVVAPIILLYEVGLALAFLARPRRA